MRITGIRRLTYFIDSYTISLWQDHLKDKSIFVNNAVVSSGVASVKLQEAEYTTAQQNALV